MCWEDKQILENSKQIRSYCSFLFWWFGMSSVLVLWIELNFFLALLGLDRGFWLVAECVFVVGLGILMQIGLLYLWACFNLKKLRFNKVKTLDLWLPLGWPGVVHFSICFCVLILVLIRYNDTINCCYWWSFHLLTCVTNLMSFLFVGCTFSNKK